MTFRLDRELPDSLATTSSRKCHVAVDIFDGKRLVEVLDHLEALGVEIVSAISIELKHRLVHEWETPDPDWVAAVVASNNHEWLADDSYVWPFDWSQQRVVPEQPLRVYTAPRGVFSGLGHHFGARASFRRFVESMPESFEFTAGDVVRKGKTLESWSRLEPLRDVSILSADSLGAISTTRHPQPFRSHILWMGSRLREDFGYAWDPLWHGWLEQERSVVVPVGTAIKLSRRFPGDFLGYPVLDRESAMAVRAIEAVQMVRERLPMKGWS
ncbi:MAG: hypothetical protein KDB14_02085 [Planctomycetales bacterium]|nr:hypothetical protein [Planctomycetales bacterium]